MHESTIFDIPDIPDIPPRPAPPLQEEGADYSRFPRFTSTSEASYLGGNVATGIAVRVTKVHPPVQIGGLFHYRLTLMDLESEQQIITTPIRDPSLLRRARDAARNGTRMMVFGTLWALVLDEPDDDPSSPAGRRQMQGPAEDKRPMHIDMLDLRPLSRPTSMLGPSNEEMQTTQRLLDQLIATPGGLRLHLRSEARALTHAATAALSERFQIAEELIMLQALSYGQVLPNVNSRLSLYLYSHPGIGKKLLVEQARLFAPLSELVQPGMVSAAGLGARVEMGPGGFVAHPGILPKCSGGVCTIDDIHRIAPRDVNILQAILMSVLEDGKISPAKAASATYESRCGVLLCSNPLSILKGKVVVKDDDPASRHKIISMPYDFMSRMDIVINLDCGDNAVRAAGDIARQSAYPETRHDETQAPPTVPEEAARRTRSLKRLVACVLERFAVVDLDPVADLMEELMSKVGMVLREYTGRLGTYHADSLLRRMANTARKLVGALSRADGRGVATAADVDRAFDLLSLKMEVVRWVCGQTERIVPLPSQQKQLERAVRASNLRWHEIVWNFGGRTEVTAAEIATLVMCSEAMVRRELHKRGVMIQDGTYDLPTLAEVQAQAQAQPVTPEEEVKEGIKATADEPPVQVEPEEPDAAPEGGAIFDDNLPDPPPVMLGVQEALVALPLASQHWYAEQILNVALFEEPEHQVDHQAMARFISHGLSAVNEQNLDKPLTHEEREGLLAGLSADEWISRGLFGLGLYIDTQMESMTWYLERFPKERPEVWAKMPPALKDGVDAVLRRLVRYEEAEKQEQLEQELNLARIDRDLYARQMGRG